jgi:hypothetical protein
MLTTRLLCPYFLASPQAAAQARQQGMPPSVLDAMHDLLEQAVQGWRCTTRLKA